MQRNKSWDELARATVALVSTLVRATLGNLLSSKKRDNFGTLVPYIKKLNLIQIFTTVWKWNI